MSCGFVQEFLRLEDSLRCQVDDNTCRACSRCLNSPNDVNPVKASLIFRIAGEIVRSGGAPGCSARQAEIVRSRIVNHLGTVVAGRPEIIFPPMKGGSTEVAESSARGDAERPSARRIWMVGMLTAARTKSCLVGALNSLSEAGFQDVHLFAEPGSSVPDHPALGSVTVHRQRLGNLANFLTSLTDLYQRSDSAECFAVFQDDIIASANLRAWCDRELWPCEAGLVSLFTPRIHAADRPGWRVLFPGFYRVHGGQALLFRRDVLERFLSDPQTALQLRLNHRCDDALVSGWATKKRIGIAYHTPSPVQHVGTCSSIFPGGSDPLNVADFVADTDQFGRWEPPLARPAKIGLIGWNTNTGLGHLNRDLARHLNLDRWIIPVCSYTHTLPPPESPRRANIVPADLPREDQIRLLEGLDWLLFAERPFVPGILDTARELGLRLACIPMWEWLNPRGEWLHLVDRMICPTLHAYHHLQDWRHRYAYSYEVTRIAWPIDFARFPFRLRRRCGRFLFINGFGGGPGVRLDGTKTPYGRKGLDTILETARLAPHLTFEIFSQAPISEQLPANVHLNPTPAVNADLYHRGDICVQPSRWEGLGLQLLECQAAGLPLITTDAPPMNEYEPLALIPVDGKEIITLEKQPILSHRPSPHRLAEILDGFVGEDLTQASRQARAYIEQNHNWGQIGQEFQRLLQKL